MAQKYTFAPHMNGDIVEPTETRGLECSVPWRRHVRIVKPKAGSHRKAGQIYIQRAEEY